MSKVLVTYATQSGSTAEVAQAVAQEIERAGCQVDLRPLDEAPAVDGYDLVVIGAPMILGWSRAAVRFVHRHRLALARRRVAYFCTLMNLTQTGETSLAGIPLCADPQAAQPPRNPRRLGLKERYATPANYLRPALQAAPLVKPVSVAFLGGRMELFRLKWWQMLFVMLVIQAKPADLRNWPLIRAWAGSLVA